MQIPHIGVTNVNGCNGVYGILINFWINLLRRWNYIKTKYIISKHVSKTVINDWYVGANDDWNVAI